MLLYRGLSDLASKLLSIQLPLRTFLSQGVYTVDLTPQSPHYYDFSFKDVYLVQKNYYLLDIVCSTAVSFGIFLDASERRETESDESIGDFSLQSSLCGCGSFFHSHANNNIPTSANSFEVLSIESKKFAPGYQGMMKQLQTDRFATWCVSKRPVCTSKSSDRSCHIKVDPLVHSCVWIQEGNIPSVNMSRIVGYDFSVPTLGTSVIGENIISVNYRHNTNDTERESNRPVDLKALFNTTISLEAAYDIIKKVSTVTVREASRVVRGIPAHLACLVLGTVLYLGAEDAASSKYIQLMLLLMLAPLLLVLSGLSQVYR